MILDLNIAPDKKKAEMYFSKLLNDGSKIELKKIAKKRTLNQNSYLHAILTLYATEWGWTLEEAKTYVENSLRNKTISTTLLFHGVTGTGKTSFARIIAMGLTCRRGIGQPCGECDSCQLIRRNNHLAYEEYNCAKDIRGIEDLRDRGARWECAAMGFDKKIIALDECHALSKPLQIALNHILENSNEQTYFFLCTINSFFRFFRLYNEFF